MTPDEADAFLLTLPRFAGRADDAYRPGLERIRALLDAMGAPHQAAPVLHVAGTNGKGSTASMLAAIGTAWGWRVGLHTSPHLLHLTERMRVDGRPAPRSWLAGAVARYRDVFRQVGPSFFEATVALSFRYFADAEVDLVVAEVGLGGRLDATNVVLPEAAVITHIGLDHTALLGPTHAAIAREKGGIIKPGVPVVTAVTHPDARHTLEEMAAARKAPFHHALDETQVTATSWQAGAATLHGLTTPEGRYETLRLDLAGPHQVANARLALRTLEVAIPERPGLPQAAASGLGAVRARAGLRGRAEVLNTQPPLMLDVAHNADGLEAALAAARAVQSGPVHVLLGLMRDKDAAALGAVLATAGISVTPVGLPTERALPGDALAATLAAAGAAVTDPAPDPVSAWQAMQAQHSAPGAVLATGSHEVVAALLRHLDR